MMKFADDGYCFVCGPRNPIGLKLDFHFDGETIQAVYIPKKEHQGYLNIVHGGILTTLLDEAMVKLAIAMKMPAVTAHMDVRLRKSLNVGDKARVEAKISKKTKKFLEAYAEVVKEDGVRVADVRGKLIRISMEEVESQISKAKPV
jgi:uncharacterized protein (TIGR00369 family)